MPDPYQQLSIRERTGLDAIQDYARQALVYLVDGPIGPNMPTAASGSGTVLRTPGGAVVILTARHVVDPLPAGGMSLGGQVGRGFSNALAKVFLHPDADVDVAVALLSAEGATVLGPSAISVSVVAEASDTTFLEENPMILCGWPAAYKRTRVDYSAGIANVEFACVSYATEVRSELDQKGRYCATWREAVVRESKAFMPEGKVGEVFNLAHPGGISGGPLWRFRRVEKDELWAPAKMAMIVGIASSYLADDGIEFCPSVSVWGEWFRETIARIDSCGA